MGSALFVRVTGTRVSGIHYCKVQGSIRGCERGRLTRYPTRRQPLERRICDSFLGPPKAFRPPALTLHSRLMSPLCSRAVFGAIRARAMERLGVDPDRESASRRFDVPRLVARSAQSRRSRILTAQQHPAGKAATVGE